MTTRSIETAVLAVLSAGRCDGQRFFLPPTQLDRKLYERTNDVLTALGGKWNRSAKAHIFAEPCTDRIEGAIETGEFTRPADMGWFPTPAALAQRAVDLARVTSGMRVLEPSAGEGAIVRPLLATGAKVYAVEIDQDRARKLAKITGLNVYRGDFMDYRPQPAFDRIVMNPPFAKRADVLHVLHARSLLAPGGRLVSIMSAGVMFREDRLTQDFRDKIDTIEELPEGAFRESGTDVRTCIVTLTV